jgi:hypothetical protein
MGSSCAAGSIIQIGLTKASKLKKFICPGDFFENLLAFSTQDVILGKANYKY